MNPADQLTAAADKLRALATAASTDNDGTPTANWHAAPHWPDDPTLGHNLYGDHFTRDDGRTVSWPLLNRGGSQQRRPYMHAQHAEYAAVMGPGVGLTLAPLLDAAHKMATEYPGLARDHDRQACDDYACDLVGHALAVARQILGGDPA